MPRTLTTALAAGVLGIGVATATVVGAPVVASAVTGQQADDPVSKRVSSIRDALKGLVDDKTITAEQADKVADTLGKSDQFRGGPGGPGGHGPGRGFGIGGPEAMKTLASALGMSEADVRTGLEGGKTIAELAKEKGKDVADVEAALVKAATARIDQAVKDGKLTAAQATEAKSRLSEMVKRFVEDGRPGRGGHGPGMGGPRGEAPDAPPTPATPAPSPSATTESSVFTTA